jgi:polysaccharide pyruvyl transferase CsaB
MTKYVVSGYIGFDNFGDEAIASVLAKHLKEIGAEEITWISANPKKTAEAYNVKSVGMFNFLLPIIKSDVLISGGGSLLQDITSLKSLIYYLGVISTALFFGKKVVIFAQGFSSFRTKIGEFLTKLVLKKCTKISVRDKNSQNVLSKMGISSTLVSDPMFIPVLNSKDLPKAEKTELIVQLRDFPTLTDEFLDKLGSEINNRFKNTTIKLLSLQDSVDLAVLEKFQSKLHSAEILSGLSTEEVIKELSNAQYLVGMRFHACLIGAKYNVNVLGINYDKKVETLAQQVGFPLLELDGRNMEKSFEELFEQKKYNIPEFNFDNLL